MDQSGALAIRRFDPRKMMPHSVILMIAKRRSGKSVLVKDLMYYKRHDIITGLAMSGTENGNGFYGSWLPPIFVYSEYDKDALQRLVNRQKKMTKVGKAVPVFVILDDLGFDKKVMNDKLIRELFLNGRHYKITLFICLQYALDISPALRSNIDYVFVLRENVFREKLYKSFFSIIPNLGTFNSVMDSVTADYGALVLDNTGHSSKLTDNVFWYKAKFDRPPFKIGSPEAWKFSRSRCKKDEDDEDPSASKQKPKPLVVLKKR
jgi:hypothetical protein